MALTLQIGQNKEIGQLKHFHFYGIVFMQPNLICICDATQTHVGKVIKTVFNRQALCSFKVNKIHFVACGSVYNLSGQK